MILMIVFLLRWIKENVPDWATNSIIVSPDANGAKRFVSLVWSFFNYYAYEVSHLRATTLADRLDVDFALINRNRSRGDAPGVEGKMEILVGDVRDKVSSL